MRTRSAVRALALTSLLTSFAFLAPAVLRPSAAYADARGDIKAKIADAMTQYDNFEYAAARKLLNQALTIAARGGLDKDPLAAQIYIAQGIVAYLGEQDEDAARLAFTQAAAIDPAIQLQPDYRTPEMAALLDESRGPVDTGPSEPQADCTEVTGIEHQVVMNAKAGVALPLTALLGSDTAAASMKIHYRTKGEADYRAADMTSKDGCSFSGKIPVDGMRGDMIHYYIAAYDGAGEVLAQDGSDGVPNLVELAPGPSGGRDGENPLGGDEGPAGGITKGGKPPKVFFGLGIGSGVGYVSGTTERAMNDVGCCFAPALLHFTPELGFGVTAQVAVSLVARIGLPIGANIEGNSTAAPAALARVRYRLRTDGTGVHVQGMVGGGFLRNTIKLETPAGPGMDTDIVTLGPLLLGAGAGYSVPLGDKGRLIADVSAILGLPVIKEVGGYPMNTGAQFDATLGVQFGF
jgi:hypothetical protein